MFSADVLAFKKMGNCMVAYYTAEFQDILKSLNKSSSALFRHNIRKLNSYKEMQAEHSTFRCAAYHAAESGITTTIPINNHTSFGVAVRWLVPPAEHLARLDFFVTFFLDKKSNRINSGNR